MKLPADDTHRRRFSILNRRAYYLTMVSAVMLLGAGFVQSCDDPAGNTVADVLAEEVDDLASVDVPASQDTHAELSDVSSVEAEDTSSSWVAPEPALFDCRSISVPLPGRVSPVPMSCLTDVDCGTPMIVGHRGFGSGATAPENSRAALRAAIRLGLDGVELDVRHTLDGQLVLMHDGSVDRTTSGTGDVSVLSFAEVTALPLDLDLAEGDFSCETVPSLAEAFELTRDRLIIHIDAKTERADLIALAIEGAGLLDQVIISTPDLARAQLARQTVPRVMVQVRPDTAEEVEVVFSDFSTRLPELFEIDDPLLPEVETRIHEGQRKILVNAWGADVTAFINGELAGYLQIVDRGADLLQCEYPLFALRAMGRYP